MKNVSNDHNEKFSKMIMEWAEFLPSPGQIIDHEKWLIKQYGIKPNILPLRHFKSLPKGATVTQDQVVYYGADNELLSSFIKRYENGFPAPSKSLQRLIVEKEVFVSWHPKVKPDFAAKYGPCITGQKLSGFKSAHLLDAGRNHLGYSEEDLKRRSHRSLSLINCFPFPNRTFYSFQMNGESYGDPAENKLVQAILLSFMKDYINNDEIFSRFLKHTDAKEISILRDWRTIASAMRICCRRRV